MDRPAKRGRLMERADEHMARGEYYDALMLYKGQVARGTAQKVTDICTDGVEKLSTAEQDTLAAELGVCAVEKLGLPFTDVLLRVMRDATKVVFLKDILAWARSHQSPSHDLQVLQVFHKTLGTLLSKETTPDLLSQAQYHLSQGGRGTCDTMLVAASKWSAPHPSEAPLFHVRTFLLYLLSSNPAEATLYVAKAPASPLMVICAFLYTAVHKGSLDLFKHIVDKSGLLSKDAKLGKSLAAIESMYFNAGPMVGSVPAAVSPTVPTPAPAASPAPVAAPSLPSHPDLD
eukprot:TRINITY_DN24487_c0_g1_i1.p1 TRINITY_DN24487_c0_g1~~TRINITY_DN24487_c0_g1_i1.p1  ORF type:complete len:312 (+),score=71.48 TRINITY_DN24487_c0_g1_i1:74-937(+)